MKFEWDDEKSHANMSKHGIDFDTAKALWDDPNRVEIHTPYPIENRNILIGKIGNKLWASVFTTRGNAVRIISVRRARKKEIKLHDQKENS
ncbi:MAG: BrnT family toxin [Deltaproteobacteria bacterium]|nr:BrnT family toxin [Deltaproteobacteria bacterium]